jgi:23S rRNA 5-hydroxycytidine C2501 synthase
MKTNPIELLSPAKNAGIGIAAINCGADAVYIGAERYGARADAGNSLKDLDKLIHYAHRYWARVYATVNTILHDHEIPDAVKLIHSLHDMGIDAVIIQDVGLLMCDLPPIPVIASTQMHNNTSEKILFLEKIGIQRAILARELDLEAIRDIRNQTTMELEFFVHGALCVSYSGQCYMSYALGGRSGNRGVCAQPCRRRYSLIDSNGRKIVQNRYLLSLRDLNLSDHLSSLIHAGITSFKIEGRLKDKPYVMNVVGYYRRKLDAVLQHGPSARSSSGDVHLDFEPDLDKTFNRGFTSYFVSSRSKEQAALLTPKSMGEAIGKVTIIRPAGFTIQSSKILYNGDGLCFFDQDQVLHGTYVNKVVDDLIIPDKMEGIQKGTMIYRNLNPRFLQRLEKSRVQRRIGIEMNFTTFINGFVLTAADGEGNTAECSVTHPHISAEKPEKMLEIIRRQLQKCGDSEFSCQRLSIDLPEIYFVPLSVVNSLRRGVVEKLRQVRESNRPIQRARIEKNDAPYPERELSYMGNVLNQNAVQFFRQHGVSSIEPAVESGLDMTGRTVMTTRYCIKYQVGICGHDLHMDDVLEPLYLLDEGGEKYQLEFNCQKCEMTVYWRKG